MDVPGGRRSRLVTLLPVFVTTRRAAVALAAVAVLAGVAGCGGGGSKPTSLPSLTANTSASPSPTSSTAQLAAITAAVREYYRLLNASTTEANGHALEALMTPDCSCRRVATSTIDAARKHQTYFGVTSVVSVTPILDGATTADALVEYDYTASGLRDDQGRTISRSGARKGSKLIFYFRLVDAKWLISTVRSVSDGRPA